MSSELPWIRFYGGIVDGATIFAESPVPPVVRVPNAFGRICVYVRAKDAAGRTVMVCEGVIRLPAPPK